MDEVDLLVSFVYWLTLSVLERAHWLVAVFFIHVLQFEEIHALSLRFYSVWWHYIVSLFDWRLKLSAVPS